MPLPLDSWYTAREDLVSYTMDDLQGAPNESIKGKPLNRIIVGVLYPRPAFDQADPEIELDGNNSLEYGQEKHRRDDRFVDDFEVSLANSSLPSSMGLTVAISSRDPSRIICEFEATRYTKGEDSEIDGKKVSTWHPEVVSDSVDIICHRNLCTAVNQTLFEDEERGLRVTAVTRPARDQRVSVTVSIVNINHASSGELKDAICWFRPRLRLSLIEGNFIEGGPHYEMEHRSLELQELDFLYRNEPNLALGHGCSPTWDRESACVTEISSTFFPSYEVLLADPNPGAARDRYGEYDLRIQPLTQADSYDQLDLLCAAYDKWIDDQREVLDQERSTLTALEYEIGLGNLERAVACNSRIRSGIAHLRDDKTGDLRLAFRLMNEAMLEQRRDPSRPESVKDFKWRPFQIAFILMNLPGLSDPEHDDRDLADILWFPTGGGKTEAYLGCIAFTIFLRRIRHPQSGGVSAIMRYTLRLLTSDQFDRAARLICAMEVTRRQRLPQSTVPISLGMWVGSKTTPNSHDAVERELAAANSGEFNRKVATSHQVRECPRCRTEIPLSSYAITAGELVVRCPNRECEFDEGLPLYFVDEDVYTQRPSLVIGTVDKFASMAWQPRVAELLSTDGKDLAPDLIVQDEFHLLSGPLGTMVGLYEGAIDLAITESSGHKPKVIASTATIRQAAEQTKAIFNRRAVQFPPPGLDPNDNYFSKTASREQKGSRRYVGVMAPGTSQSTMLVRLYAALLQGVSELVAPADLSDEQWNQVIDTYWTLLGYFNSLRVLGSASLQAVDDIPLRIKAIAKRRGVDERRGPAETLPSELTSRKDSGEIALTRQNMSRPYPDHPDTPNIVLATNMISVGLDIDRLGLMVVAGQPQNSSEYIQATSRVGRQHPGLVFVAFNAARTRDVSHFESFEFFHRTLYRSVEATTATPFSPRARDRGAHGVLVSASRLLNPELRGPESAAEIADNAGAILSTIVEPLVDRARDVLGADSEEVSAFEIRLRRLVDEWVDFAGELEADGSKLTYGARKNPAMSARASDDQSLLVQAGTHDGPDRFGEHPPWETLTSLRDVDSETHLVLHEGGPSDGNWSN